MRQKGLSTIAKSALVRSFIEENHDLREWSAPSIAREIKKRHGVKISSSAIYNYFRNAKNGTLPPKRHVSDEIVNLPAVIPSKGKRLVSVDTTSSHICIHDLMRLKTIVAEFGSIERLKDALDQFNSLRS